MFKPWMLAAMEDEGYMDTSDGLINRVAKYLAKSSNDTIDTAEFRSACIACTTIFSMLMLIILKRMTI